MAVFRVEISGYDSPRTKLGVLEVVPDIAHAAAKISSATTINDALLSN